MEHLKLSWKHPLFSISTWPLVTLLGEVLRIGPAASVRATIAALAALNVVLAYAVLRRSVDSRAIAASFAVLYALLAGNLLIFSIPETYSTTNLAILAFLVVFFARRDRLGWREALGLGGMAALAALYNPPLITLAAIPGVYAWHEGGLKGAATIGFISLGVAASIFLVVNVTAQAAKTGAFFAFGDRSVEYAGHYVALAHFVDPRIVTTVASVFFLFGVVARTSALLEAPAPEQLGGYLSSPTGMIALVLYAALLLHVLARCARERSAVETSLLAWVGGIFLFYIYWQPWTTTRFSVQILAPLTVVLARAFEALGSRLKSPALAAFSICLAAYNLTQLGGAR